MFEELISSINRWLEWYLKQVYKNKSDYTFEVDKEGNETLIDECLSLNSKTGKKGYINRELLNNEIETLRIIRLELEFKKFQEKYSQQIKIPFEYGKGLIEYLEESKPLERSKLLIKVIDPYINHGLNYTENPGMERDKAKNIALKRSAELFGCPISNVEEGYKQYGYFLPASIIEGFFWDKIRHRFIPALDKVIEENKAQKLFNDSEKIKIDARIEEQNELGLPISEAISELKEKYRPWSISPKPGNDLAMYYCWREFIEPYLNKFDPSIKHFDSLKTISFEKLFKPEFRKYLPDKVIQYLGPGQADAWMNVDGHKKWIYKGPENTIMIPFFILLEMKKIEYPVKGKKLFITSWVNEFGITYKDKTFDIMPKNHVAYDHFMDYLKKIV
ncbi:MAG: hypothetical protein GX432_11680 [Candidatus Atribacteria bacterium]|nr:hypothetical protein [Candidatus Atribacteria bacterium]